MAGFIRATPNWKNLHRLSERLASPCKIGAQLGAALKPLNTIMLWWTRGFRGCAQLGTMMPRDAGRYVWSVLFFQSDCDMSYGFYHFIFRLKILRTKRIKMTNKPRWKASCVIQLKVFCSSYKKLSKKLYVFSVVFFFSCKLSQPHK